MTQILRQGVDRPVVSICIPTFSAGLERVDQCLAAIADHTRSDQYETVVVDCQGELRGYTAPQNEAMEAAKGQILIAMNDDVLVTPGWIDPLIHALFFTDIWCVTPDQTHADGPQVFAPYCMAWHRWAWTAIGGLDSQFKWWCSDIDIARRLADLDRLPLRVRLPVPIQHQIGATATGVNQLELNEMARHDLDRFQQKWGVGAEVEKYRLRDLVWSA